MQPPPPAHPEAPSPSDLRDLFDALACWLETHAEQLNALNVFPVPDGDTGINMSRTLRAAADAAASTPGTACDILAGAARGALLGAAGNSGVILSQMIRGFCEALPQPVHIDAPILKRALRGASDAGYASVTQPAEGTMLTVARETAQAVYPEATLRQAIRQALDGATEAVAATPLQLEKLRAAGVVDAGGEGLRLIIEGIGRWIDGEDLRAAAPAPTASRAIVGAQHTEGEAGFCTQFIIEGSRIAPDELRHLLQDLSTSLIVVGTPELLRVHAHAIQPGRVLDLAVGAGTVSRISIENMELQHAAAQADEHAGTIGVIAVAPSEKAAALLQSLGATMTIIPTGTSPTVEEMLSAVQRSGHEQILLYPNDKNSIMAAEQLRQLTPRSIQVIASASVVQCIQSLLSFNPDQPLEQQHPRLQAALTTGEHFELARATRATDVDTIHVEPGDTVVLHAGALITAAPNPTAAALRIADNSIPATAELLTIYLGADMTADELGALRGALEQRFPDLEIEIVDLGLPARQALLVVE